MLSFDIKWILFGFTLLIGGLIFYLFKEYFDKNNDEHQSRRSSAEEEDDIVSTAKPLLSENIIAAQKRKAKRNPFKKIYSNIMHTVDDNKSSLNDNAPSQMQYMLRRRHSTVFPLAQVAKELLRGRGAYRRQMSEVSREEFPQPPMEFFEPSALPEIPDEFKPLFYIHHNVKLLEIPSNWVLDRNDIELLTFEANESILRPGDEDDAMYVVLNGQLAVYISLPEGKECLIKRIDQGYSFYSLLSLLDIFMRLPSTLKTVSLKTTQRSHVARYSFRHFQKAYEHNPAFWVRSIQIIITRLLHVTLTPLHQYLGLGEELFKRKLDERNFDDRHRNISGHSIKLLTKFKSQQSRRLSSSDGENELFLTAIRWFSELLHISYIDAHNLLQTRIQIVNYEEDQIISESGIDTNPNLALILFGAVKICQEVSDVQDDPDDLNWCAYFYQKELIGGLHLLSNEPAFYSVKAACPTSLAIISKPNFNKIIEIMPAIVLPVAYSVIKRLSPFVRAVDFVIDWILTDSGQAVYRQGDIAESVYVVLSGRLRSVVKKTVIEEYGRDNVLGILEMLQHKPRSTTVLAVRFSQLARVPEGLLNFAKMQFPQVGFQLVRMLGQYYNENRRINSNFIQLTPASINDPISHIKIFQTIAVFPASLDVPVIPFTCELYHALNASTKVLRLSSKKVAESLGVSVLEKQADFRLMRWLNEQEDNYSLIIYECDYTATNWTRRCLRQADAIFVVANGEVEPPEQQFIDEHLKMNQDGIRTRKELVLLWRENITHPEGTFNWLKGSWFSGHYHIRSPDRMYKWHPSTDKEETEILKYYEDNVFYTKVDFFNDFSRLGRILTGNAVGLVLGGGGARGAAHIGIIKALKEHGIPIDIVGGTSIGSMIGGIFSENPNQRHELFIEKASSWFRTMTSLWRKIWDLTYAHSAMFTGSGFNSTLQDTFGKKFIEDCWLPYFCITTDISTSEMRVHRSGLLWKYSRASMSLAGYLPPLCDPSDGHLLLDGGYVNNLPADVMRSLGAKCVIAVDVGAAPEKELYNYGDSLSGFWVLLRKLNPWSQSIRILGMEEIQSRLAFVSCVRQLEQVKKAPYCHYLRPPIDSYRTLDFAKFDEIYEIGYKYGMEVISELVRSNANIKSVMNPAKLRKLTKIKSIRRRESGQSLHNSFTDLAAQISRIPTRHNGSMLSLNDVSISENEFSSDWFRDVDDKEDEKTILAMTAAQLPFFDVNSDKKQHFFVRDDNRGISETVTEIDCNVTENSNEYLDYSEVENRENMVTPMIE